MVGNVIGIGLLEGLRDDILWCDEPGCFAAIGDPPEEHAVGCIFHSMAEYPDERSDRNGYARAFAFACSEMEDWGWLVA